MMPNAIGRSNPDPSFFRSAGARLMVIRVGRNIVATVLKRRAYSLAALFHGGVGKAYRAKLFLAMRDSGDIDFNLDQVGVDTVHRCA